VSVKVQRGLDSSVSQLLLRDLGGYADIVQDGSVYVAKLMPRYSLKPSRLRSRPGRRRPSTPSPSSPALATRATNS